MKCLNLKLIKKEIAFSLIEVMISLIILSLVTAAVVPVITKKITKKSIKIEYEENSEKNEYTTDCSELIASNMVSENCILCTKGDNAVCKRCPIECSENMFVDISTCECKECKLPDCEACKTEFFCYKCYVGESGVYYSDSGECKLCPKGAYCNGITATLCPKGSYSDDELGSQACIACPENTYSETEGATSCTPCPEGKYAEQGSASCSSCISTDEGNCACTKSDDTCVRCKFGYKLNNGVCEVVEDQT